MAKIRVYELARDLSMTNKILLEKIESMDIVVKSHMSSLEDETVSLIKANLMGAKDQSKIEEKRVRPTVIRRRKKVVEAAPPPQPEEEAATAESEETATPAEETKPTEAADIPQEVTEEKMEVEAPEAEAEPTEEVLAAQKPVEAPAEEPPVLDEEPEAVETAELTPVDVEKAPEPEIPEEEAVETAQPEPAKLPKKVKKRTAAKIIKLPTTPVERPEPPAEETARGRKKGKPDQTRVTEAKPAPKDLPAKDSKKKKKRKPGDEEQDRQFFKKKISFKRKAVVEGKALYDTANIRGRKGRKGAKVKPASAMKTQITTPKAIKRRIKMDDAIILSELSKRMGIKANEMIQKLMMLGVMATVNQTIDYDTAVLVASEFGYEVEKASFEEDTILAVEKDDPEKMTGRPPVVTIMGHVDHGKTSLLDVIRKSSITSYEAGGITQHIGAYSVETEKGQISFLDTPGHEAFTAMRSRGAQVTDIVILVVAADDGVMPQTIEAINHSKAAEVPIIVAVNKIDKPDADPDRVKRELSEHGIVAEDWGGDAIFVNVSAKENKGIDDLLDMILLQTEVLELKANSDKLARGHVIEAKLDSGRGPVATILVKEGTLHTGESVVCGIHYGKIRAMLNDKGVAIESAGPSIPVEILGLSGVPVSGDEMVALEDEKRAKQVSGNRMQKQRAKELAKSSRLSLEGLFEKLEEGEIKDLNLILKADVQGSIEALKDSLTKLSGSEVKVNIVHSATGTVTESDISLATVSNAIILGFNVRPSAKVQEMANEENVDMRFYDIIYNAIKDIKDAMVGLMESTYDEHVLGRAQVREVFVIPKVGAIAGCYITDGKVERGKQVRLLREGVIIYDGKISSLRRFKDDAKEVTVGYECGIGIENFNDIKINDEIQCYYLEEIKPTMA